MIKNYLPGRDTDAYWGVSVSTHLPDIHNTPLAVVENNLIIVEIDSDEAGDSSSSYARRGLPVDQALELASMLTSAAVHTTRTAKPLSLHKQSDHFSVFAHSDGDIILRLSDTVMKDDRIGAIQLKPAEAGDIAEAIANQAGPLLSRVCGVLAD